MTTKDQIYLYQKFEQTDEIRLNCILEEIGVNNCIFFDDANGLCLTKDKKISLYNVSDLILRYVTQLDQEEKERLEKENGGKRRSAKMSSAQLDSMVDRILGGSKTPSMAGGDNKSDNDDDDDSAASLLNIANEILDEQKLTILRYKTLYIETRDPLWSILKIEVCCTSDHWWIGMIDNFGSLHVIKIQAGWPEVDDKDERNPSRSRSSLAISSDHVTKVYLWKEQPNTALSRSGSELQTPRRSNERILTQYTDDGDGGGDNDNNNGNEDNINLKHASMSRGSTFSLSKLKTSSAKWLLGMWSLMEHKSRILHLKWYLKCNRCVLIMLDENGGINLWNEPVENSASQMISENSNSRMNNRFQSFASQNHFDSNFCFRCILSLSLTEENHDETSMNSNVSISKSI